MPKFGMGSFYKVELASGALSLSSSVEEGEIAIGTVLSDEQLTDLDFTPDEDAEVGDTVSDGRIILKKTHEGWVVWATVAPSEEAQAEGHYWS